MPIHILLVASAGGIFFTLPVIARGVRGAADQDWAHTISSACSTYPTLAEKYLPPLIAELEEKLREQPDPDDQRELDYIRENLERARSMSS